MTRLDELKKAFASYMREMVGKELWSPFGRLEEITAKICLMWVSNNYTLTPIGNRKEPDGMPDVCVPSPAWYDQPEEFNQ